MKRRAFITALGGAAVTSWVLRPRATLAQRAGERLRRIGVLSSFSNDDAPEAFRDVDFFQALQGLGWNNGRNIRIDHRWGDGIDARIRAYAAELVSLAPDVIVSSGGQALRALLQAMRSVPIVFTQVLDPVGQGLIASLAKPGGNATGFTPFEYGMSEKWLELLKQVAPRVARVAVLRDATLPGGIGQWNAIELAAPLFGVELHSIDVGESARLERAITEFALSPNGGLIVVSGVRAAVHRDVIIRLAAQHRLPAVYPYRQHVVSGGLIFYGPESVDQYRRAAGYVDRILKGDRPADLPVQAPVKYETVLNLKTAKAMGLDVPATVYARASEVIE